MLRMKIFSSTGIVISALARMKFIFSTHTAIIRWPSRTWSSRTWSAFSRATYMLPLMKTSSQLCVKMLMGSSKSSLWHRHLVSMFTMWKHCLKGRSSRTKFPSRAWVVKVPTSSITWTRDESPLWRTTTQLCWSPYPSWTLSISSEWRTSMNTWSGARIKASLPLLIATVN